MREPKNQISQTEMDRAQDMTFPWGDRFGPSITLTRQRYRQMGLFRWDDERVRRVCNQIGCNPYELSAVAGYFGPIVSRKRYWPVYLTIHFAKLEDQIHRAKFLLEPEKGPGPEDVEMARLIAKGQTAEPLNTEPLNQHLP